MEKKLQNQNSSPTDTGGALVPAMLVEAPARGRFARLGWITGLSIALGLLLLADPSNLVALEVGAPPIDSRLALIFHATELLTCVLLGILIVCSDLGIQFAQRRRLSHLLARPTLEHSPADAAVDMHIKAAHQLELEADLAQALSRSEFIQYYQPIVDLATGRWLGFEALLRWQHPQRGLLFPAAFLDVAEQAGYMIPIGKWGLREACRQLADWQAYASPGQPLYMSVNLSARQFLHPAIVDDIASVLAETQLAPAQLLIEITEHVALQDAETTRRTLRALRSLGVRLAIDDFGTGFSALSYLKQFDVDVLKLDRSFLAGIEAEPGSAALVSAVIAFARRLNLQMIAEGVETDAQRALLHELRCSTCQGFFFARPMPPAAIEDRLSRPAC